MGEQRDAVPQKDGGDLQNDVVHHVLLQQRGQDGISPHHPDAFLPAQGLHKVGYIAADRGESGAGKGTVMGEHIISGGWVNAFRGI